MFKLGTLMKIVIWISVEFEITKCPDPLSCMILVACKQESRLQIVRVSFDSVIRFQKSHNVDNYVLKWWLLLGLDAGHDYQSQLHRSHAEEVGYIEIGLWRGEWQWHSSLWLAMVKFELDDADYFTLFLLWLLPWSHLGWRAERSKIHEIYHSYHANL